jgi:cytochrome c oxidase subunit II
MDSDATTLHSVLEPLGVHAQHIDIVWNAMLWVCGIMYVIVLAFLALALLRRRRGEGAERALSRSLAVWTALVILGLFGLTLTSFLTDRALVRAAPEPQLSLRITGHQWWWEVEYAHADASQQVRTANELHLPVNAQVHVELASADVIHSFWAPNLHGKRDLIPGRTSEIRLEPMQVGVYRAQCAEFCGYQHANMALHVVVESPADFERWRQRQLASAPPPQDARAQAGLRVFMDSACNLCHAISGTPAFGQTGPDLTHLAGRRSLAAGALANTPENLRRWLANPQQVKPGNHMPVVSLSDEQLDALTAYLSSLQ